VEADVGSRQPELLEEDVRHAAVVVLARVHDDDVEGGIGPQLAIQWGDLHEVGPGAGHQANARQSPGAYPGGRASVKQASDDLTQEKIRRVISPCVAFLVDREFISLADDPRSKLITTGGGGCSPFHLLS